MRYFVLLCALGVIVTSRAAFAGLALAGVGAQNCSLLNQFATPGRGSEQNFTTQLVYTWVQGFMSGFNGYSLLIGGKSYDLSAASHEAQWEYIVSFCRSNPTV